MNLPYGFGFYSQQGCKVVFVSILQTPLSATSVSRMQGSTKKCCSLTWTTLEGEFAAMCSYNTTADIQTKPVAGLQRALPFFFLPWAGQAVDSRTTMAQSAKR